MIQKYSFDELKLVFESTEKVIDRRLTNNKQNYTISVAILLAISFVWKWSTENIDYFFDGILLVLLLSVFAILFCSWWKEQIKDFKKLNDAKFFVINEMAKNIYFESKENEVEVVSFNSFEKEWTKLQEINALQQNTTINLKVLKSSSREFFIPSAFRVLFSITTALSLFTIGNNLNKTWLSITKILHI